MCELTDNDRTTGRVGLLLACVPLACLILAYWFSPGAWMPRPAVLQLPTVVFFGLLAIAVFAPKTISLLGVLAVYLVFGSLGLGRALTFHGAIPADGFIAYITHEIYARDFTLVTLAVVPVALTFIVLCHELFHIVAAVLVGYKIEAIHIGGHYGREVTSIGPVKVYWGNISGHGLGAAVSVREDDVDHPWHHEAVVLLAGPLANVLAIMAPSLLIENWLQISPFLQGYMLASLFAFTAGVVPWRKNDDLRRAFRIIVARQNEKG